MGEKTEPFRRVVHQADFCVVGGGIAGTFAALAAARRGARTVLMHDRPVLGGNASSEIRVHICGADRHNRHPFLRETGLLEELRMLNLACNPTRSHSIHDAVLYDMARREPNLTLLLNCSCQSAEMSGLRLRSVTGWQLTTQTRHTVEAALFADCSGDGVLIPLTGAEHRVGREARAEFGETIAPEVADRKTMGLTCAFMARPTAQPQAFVPPPWAERFEREEDLPYGLKGHQWLEMGYWWVELGGENDSIHDTEKLRDQLLAVVYGVWDHIKNHCAEKERAAHWALDWVCFLPGKRESRRYLGDHVLTQNDLLSGGRFSDLAAYGGWSMDDHDPAGFRAAQAGRPATIFHPAPSPYGIPYRSLYSRNIENLYCAGRVASCSHAAMSSTRVMGTGGVMGQAVGTAAALAARRGLPPRGVLDRIEELQQMLLRDDCHLPGLAQRFSALTTAARLSASRGNPEPVRDGVKRPVGPDLHAWLCRQGDWLAYALAAPARVAEATVVLDTALDQDPQLSHWHWRGAPALATTPEVLARDFRLEVLAGGGWKPLAEVRDNRMRQVRILVGREAAGVRFILEKTWGAPETRVYGFYLD